MKFHLLTKKKIAELGDGMHADGACLYLRKKGNAASWVFRYRHRGKLHDVGLGSLVNVPLQDARKKAAELRVAIANGEDIIKKRLRATAVIGDFIPMVEAECKKQSGGTFSLYSRVIQWLKESHASRPLADVNRDFLIKELIGTASGKAPIRNRLTVLKRLFEIAIAAGAWNKDNPVVVDSIVKLAMPAKAAVVHRASVDWTAVPDAYARISTKEMPDCYRNILLAVILCVPRIGDFVKAKVSDYDSSTHIITIRDPKIKGEPFRIPLPKQAIPLVNPGKTWLFESPLGDQLDRSTVLKRFKSVFPDATLHGFRSSFSSWCADNAKDIEVRELCLQHRFGNTVTASYQRSELLERRRALLQEWADYVTSQCTG